MHFGIMAKRRKSIVHGSISSEEAEEEEEEGGGRWDAVEDVTIQ